MTYPKASPLNPLNIFTQYLFIRINICNIAESHLLPYQVDIAKLSKSVGIDRVTLLRYMKHLAEAKLTRNIYAKQDTITDLQKPDKLMLDNRCRSSLC